MNGLDERTEAKKAGKAGTIRFAELFDKAETLQDYEDCLYEWDGVKHILDKTIRELDAEKRRHKLAWERAAG